MREPIVIGLDDSPIILTWKGVDWLFNPDPPADFLVKTVNIAKKLQAEELDEIGDLSGLLESQLTEPDQKKLWAKADPGIPATAAMLFAYLEEVTNFPT